MLAVSWLPSSVCCCCSCHHRSHASSRLLCRRYGNRASRETTRNRPQVGEQHEGDARCRCSLPPKICLSRHETIRIPQHFACLLLLDGRGDESCRGADEDLLLRRGKTLLGCIKMACGGSNNNLNYDDDDELAAARFGRLPNSLFLPETAHPAVGGQ